MSREPVEKWMPRTVHGARLNINDDDDGDDEVILQQ